MIISVPKSVQQYLGQLMVRNKILSEKLGHIGKSGAIEAAQLAGICPCWEDPKTENKEIG